MENRSPISTMKSDYLSPSTDFPHFMGSLPPYGFGAQKSLDRDFRKKGLRLLKTYQNERIQEIMPNYNVNLVKSPNTSDPLEDMRFTKKAFLMELASPKPVMPILYPEQEGKRMEDFYLIFNEQRDYFKDYTGKSPKYSYFKMGEHPFTHLPINLMDYSTSYPRKMYQTEKYFTTRNIERHRPPLPTDYSLSGKTNRATTAYKW